MKDTVSVIANHVSTFKALMVLIWAILSIGCSNVSTGAQERPIAALFRAASDGDVSKVRDLLNAGADANARENEGETPLMYAATAGKTEVINLLLDRGADIHALSINRETALARAVGAKQYDSVKLLLDRVLTSSEVPPPAGRL